MTTNPDDQVHIRPLPHPFPDGEEQCETLRQWQPLELIFTAAITCAQPLDAWDFRAVFTGPDGSRLDVSGFCDGQRRWVIRFRPDQPGAWRFETRCLSVESTLNGLSGAFTIEPRLADEANPLFFHGGIPRVGATGRHLTYSDGTPFFWLGDTWWFAPSKLVPWNGSSKPGVASTFRLLVETRASQGFNTVQMAFLGGAEADAGGGDWQLALEGKLDAAYWRRIDTCLDFANRCGLMPVIGFGFHQSLNAPTAGQLQRLWRYVLARYGALAVTFLICGEYNQGGGTDAAGKVNHSFTETDAARTQKMIELGAYIKAHDPWKRAMTVHPWAYSVEGRHAWGAPWLDFTLIQGGHGKDGPPASYYREIWDRSPSRPLLEGEVTYEGIFGFSDSIVRCNAWKAVCSGSCGFTYGAQGLWYPNQNAEDTKFSEWGPTLPWWEALARPGGVQMGILRSIVESVTWSRLEPVPPIRAEGTDADVFVTRDRGRAILAYVPEGVPRSAKIVLPEKDATKWRATLADPRTGERHAAVFPASVPDGGIALPDRPDERDWVFVLET